MQFSTAMASLAIAVLSATALVVADTQNCRKCTPEVSFSGIMTNDNLDSFMQGVMGDFTGGGGYTWQTKPTYAANWTGTASFLRLCGKDNWVDHVWTYNKLGGETKIQLRGSCKDKNGNVDTVRCRGDSNCHNSGIL